MVEADLLPSFTEFEIIDRKGKPQGGCMFYEGFCCWSKWSDWQTGGSIVKGK